MSEEYITISNHKLSNHCPECYSDEGLVLTYKQKIKETPFFKAVTRHTIKNIHCNTCDTTIYPARWTEDVDQIVDYHSRGLKLQKTSIKFKALTWILIIVAIILIIVMAISYFKDTNVIP
ncbi:MAG: hypothetical protein R3213_00500 [Flavobacteriaceae bacterium]|nr:hypothetical protein [Flavobacteriaceae bacterium]